MARDLWYPGAIVKELPENATQALIRPTLIVDHTAVDREDTTSLFGYFNQPGISVETHGYTRRDGTCEQYVSFDVRTDGAYYANSYAISWEHWDGAFPNKPIPPLTPAQVESDIERLTWMLRHPFFAGVPRRVAHHPFAATTNGLPPGGLCTHTHWGAASPNNWSWHLTHALGKNCPGDARKRQYAETIWPTVFARLAGNPPPEEDDMALTPEVKAEFDTLKRDLDEMRNLLTAGMDQRLANLLFGVEKEVGEGVTGPRPARTVDEVVWRNGGGYLAAAIAAAPSMTLEERQRLWDQAEAVYKNYGGDPKRLPPRPT